MPTILASSYQSVNFPQFPRYPPVLFINSSHVRYPVILIYIVSGICLQDMPSAFSYIGSRVASKEPAAKYLEDVREPADIRLVNASLPSSTLRPSNVLHHEHHPYQHDPDKQPSAKSIAPLYVRLVNCYLTSSF